MRCRELLPLRQEVSFHSPGDQRADLIPAFHQSVNQRIPYVSGAAGYEDRERLLRHAYKLREGRPGGLLFSNVADAPDGSRSVVAHQQ